MASPGLLPTKLHPRQSRPRIVARPRLVAELERCASYPLTVVTGPAGAGKSTAAVAWVEQTELAVGWLSLDGGDDSPGRFFAYLLAALQTAAPSLAGDPAAYLAAPEPEDARALEAMVADAIVIPLAERAQPLVVVLDDVHLLEHEALLTALGWLLEHAPACLRVIMLSRSAPRLPLARLRASGSLAELGVDALRFSPAEERSFYAEVMGLELDERELAALERQTEGWPAGAQLAALSLRARAIPRTPDSTPRGDDRLIAEYLLSEVFGDLEPTIQAVLLATAPLERVCAPLVEAVAEVAGARAALDAIDRANLFLIPLDSHRRWFRYHHLFRDFLRERAAAEGPAYLAERHLRAARWLAGRDLRQEAFEHALASGDAGLIVELFERWAGETLMRNQTGEVRRWLARIPAALREREAVFGFVDGWCDVVVGQLRTGVAKLDRAVEVLAERPAGAHVQLLVHGLGPILKIAAALRRGRYDEALAMSAAGRARFDADADPQHALALAGYLLHEALVHLDRGELDEARALLERSEELARSDRAFDVLILAHLATVHRRQGRLDEAERCARRALRYAEETGTAQLATAGMARVELAWVALERGATEAAMTEVEAGLARLRLLHDVAYLAHATELLARVKAAAGERDDALAVIDETIELLEGTDMGPARARLCRLRDELRAPVSSTGSSPAVARLAPVEPLLEPLTQREAEVLGLLARGMSNRELAAKLCVSVGTVKTHVHRILRKLDAPNRTRAVHRGRVLGLL